MIESNPVTAEKDKTDWEQSPGTTVDVVATLQEATVKLQGQHGYTQVVIRGGTYSLARGVELINSGLSQAMRK